MKRINPGGNFCGHDPEHPQLSLALPPKLGKGGIPRILTFTMERLEQFFRDPMLLPTLNFANGSSRQMRSERREACVLVCKALLKYLDLATLKIGFPVEGGFRNCSVAKLTETTGLSLRRVERAIRDLKAAGLLTVAQQRQRLQDGSWQGFVAVKAVSKLLFEKLGLRRMLAKERQRATERRKRAEAAIRKIIAHPYRQQLLSLSLKPRRTKVVRRDPDPERTKQLMLKAAELKEANRDWDREACYAAAQKLVR